ncbi:DUF4136 domain-containing protein [Dysgonomonas sp. GY617]|uniref:DUF4136 domain-containing protein n=1 Tax=Dysgonomonas sp. GY617 TaxID=2780420 RepID=UPI0018848734|nr:DUF4136 domain-containing protein [Dysgonomonas sp. GY617]MBF0575162.1 DUF4136 domain-containing protein [Dysgonomonas sp. GY617]
MRTLRLFSLVLFSALMFASCKSSLTVSTDYDRSVDFSKYKTFGIYKLDAEAQTISELNRNRIYAAIKAALTERGLTESATPDLWVNSLAFVESRESHSSTTMTTGMGMGMGGMGMGGMGMGGFHRPYMWGGPMMMTGSSVARTQHNVDIYHKGSLLVDLIDARTNTLVWHAAGNRDVDKNFGRDADEKIAKYVSKMFVSFPPATIVNTTVKTK